MRAKCINPFNINGIKDPELSRDRFYIVKDDDVRTMAIEDQPLITVQGDSGADIDRPKSSFIIFRGKR